eukprot:CAMPEP_0118860238 /NCGR_PEP_ID=MMETSP1163-20130328/6163_1 /TAXON_ID=124430 /ORGANISM="Phaeomonas parva, Strain CCMP2877" /LENGTH=34 /DNA_ID= /DNA_START= /DNA_END= /DNA_ORIENTATION=
MADEAEVGSIQLQLAELSVHLPAALRGVAGATAT